MARTLANIEKRHYRVMHRTAAAFTSPADPESSAANFATWLAAFTEIGYCRDKTIKTTIEAADKEPLDDGNEKHMGFNGHLEFLLNQSEPADYTAYEAIENVSQDVLFYSEVTGVCIWFGAVLLGFNEDITSGEVETVLGVADKKDAATKAAFRTRFAEPTT